jgi:hypothetical protein
VIALTIGVAATASMAGGFQLCDLQAIAVQRQDRLTRGRRYACPRKTRKVGLADKTMLMV